MPSVDETIKLVFKSDTTGLDKGLKRVQGSLKDLMRGDIGGFVNGLGNMAGVAGVAAVGVGALATALYKLGKGAVDYGLQVGDLASAIGATSEEASVLLEVADDMRLPISNLEMAFKTMARNGIEPSMDGLATMADRFNSLKDPTAKTAFLVDNFGRSGMEMARVLELGSGALRNYKNEMADGKILTEEQTVAASNLYLELDTLKDNFEGLAITIGTEVIPPTSAFILLLNDLLTLPAETWFASGADASAKFINSLFGIQSATPAVITSLQEINQMNLDILPSQEDIAGAVEDLNAQLGNLNESALLGNAAKALYAGDGSLYRQLAKEYEKAKALNEELRKLGDLIARYGTGKAFQIKEGIAATPSFKAAGGHIGGAAMGGLTLVGENGPELVTPGGWVMPSGRTEQALGMRQAVSDMQGIRDDISWMVRQLPISIRDAVVTAK